MIERALVVSLGSIGNRHLRILTNALPTADIKVLRRAGAAQQVGAIEQFDKLSKAIEFKPQCAIIASPAPFHIETALELANIGCHLLIEKPLSNSIYKVKKLLDLCEKKDLILQVGYNLRFLNTLQVFREKILNGTIGQVLSINSEVGQYLPSWRPNSDYRSSVSAKSELGGGVLLELSHELDYLRWIFGDINWMSAWLGKKSDLEIDVEDSAMLQFCFDTGPIAQLSMDFFRQDTSRRCVAKGSHGSISWDAVEGTVRIFEPKTASWATLLQHNANRDDTYIKQIQHFLNSIRGHSVSQYAAQGLDGLAVIEMVNAAKKSHLGNGARYNLRISK